MELHIITACALVLAFQPARGLWREIRNVWERRQINREHAKREATNA